MNARPQERTPADTEPAPCGRREAIIQSAVNTFSRHGFQASTIKRLARDAKISEALVYKYFQSKEELFDAVLNHLVKTARPVVSREEGETLPADVGDREFLIRLALRSRSRFQEHPQHLRLLYFAALQGHGLASKYFERQVKPNYEAIISRIEAGQKSGVYRRIPPAVAARAYLGMVSHQVLVQVLFKDPYLPTQGDEWAEMFADIFLKGIQK